MGGLSFKRRNIDLRYFSQDPFDRLHIFPRDRGCGCNPPAQDLHRKVKKTKKTRALQNAKERHQIAILFYLAASCAAFFFLSLSLSLPTGESENLMWPFIQSSSVRCTQERIDFGCEVFLCFIVDSIRAPGVGAAVIGCPVL